MTDLLENSLRFQNKMLPVTNVVLKLKTVNKTGGADSAQR